MMPDTNFVLADPSLLDDLQSWATLQPRILDIKDEQTVKYLMVAESKDKNRIRILDRLYSRYNKLRHERERRELSRGILPF